MTKSNLIDVHINFCRDGTCLDSASTSSMVFAAGSQGHGNYHQPSSQSLARQSITIDEIPSFSSSFREDCERLKQRIRAVLSEHKQADERQHTKCGKVVSSEVPAPRASSPMPAEKAEPLHHGSGSHFDSPFSFARGTPNPSSNAPTPRSCSTSPVHQQTQQHTSPEHDNIADAAVQQKHSSPNHAEKNAGEILSLIDRAHCDNLLQEEDNGFPKVEWHMNSSTRFNLSVEAG